MLNVRFMADLADLNRGFDRADKQVADFAKKGERAGIVDLSVNSRPLTAGLTRAEKRVGQFKAKGQRDGVVTLKLNDKAWRRGLDQAQEDLDRFRGKADAAGVISLQVDVTSLGRTLLQAETQVAKTVADINRDLERIGHKAGADIPVMLALSLRQARSDAANGAVFRVRGDFSGIADVTGALSFVRRDAADGASFRVHAEATGIVSTMGALGGLDLKAMAMDRKWGSSIHIHSEADNVPAVLAALESMGFAATRLNDTDIDIPIDVRDENARLRLNAVRALVASMQADGATVEIDAEATAARINLADMERRVDNLDGRVANVHASVSGGSSIVDLGSKIRNLGAVIAVANVPTFISLLAAVPAVASAAAAGIGGLVVGIGAGLVGAVAVGAPALGGLVLGLKAYTEILKSSVSASRESYLAQNEEVAKMLEAEKARRLNTEASAALNAEINDSVLNFASLQAAVGNEAFPAFTRELDYWNEYLVSLTPEIATTAGEVANIAANFSEFVRTAQEGRLLGDIFTFINDSATRGAQIVSNFGQAGLLVFQQLIGPATDLQLGIVGVSEATKDWVSSAEGVDRIQAGIAYTSTRAGELGVIVKDLGAGLWGLGVALEDSGFVDLAMGGLGAMASNFRSATDSSSGLTGNMERLKPVLVAVVDLAGVVYTEFFKVADAVLAATNPETGNSTLLDLLNSLADVVPTIGGVLVATFEELAPAISRNVGPVSEFVGTFVGSTDTLVAVVDSLGGMATKFNELSPATKDAVAELAALAGVAAVLGLDGGSLIQTAAYTSIIAANMVTVAPAVVRAATALWGYAAAAWAAVAPSLALYAPLAALAAIGAIAIGIAVFFDTAAFATAYDKSRESGNHAGLAFSDGVRAGMDQVPIVGTVYGWLDDGMTAATDFLNRNSPPVSLLDKITGRGANDPSIVPNLQAMWDGASAFISGLAQGESLLDRLTGVGRDDGSLVPNLQAMWDGASAFVSTLVPTGPTVLDVLLGNAAAGENPITRKLTGWWAGANAFVATLVPTGPTVLDVLMGRADGDANPITAKLGGWWAGANAFVATLVPTGPTVLDVLLGSAAAGENPITRKLAGWWEGANAFVATLVPTGPTVLDVLMGRADEGANPITAKLAGWWVGANEWMATLVPEVSILDVVMGRAPADQNPILARLLPAWTGVTEWMSTLVPEVSLLDVALGRAPAEENPILARLLPAWTGVTEWMATLVPEVSLLDVALGRAPADQNPILARLLPAWAGVTEWMAGLVPEVSLLDVALGRAPAEENPILARLLPAWAGVTAWMAGLLPEVTLFEVAIGRAPAEQNPILARLIPMYTATSTWLVTKWTEMDGLALTWWSKIAGRVTAAWTGADTSSRGTWDNNLAYLGQKWLQMDGLALQWFGAAAGRVSAAWTGADTSSRGTWDNNLAYLGTKWTQMDGLALQWFGAAAGRVTAAWTGADTSSRGTWDNNLAYLGQKWTQMDGLALQWFDSAKGRISAAWTGADTSSRGTWDNNVAYLGTKWTEMDGLALRWFDSGKKRVVDAWTGADTSSRGTWDDNLAYLGDLWTRMDGSALDFFTSMRDNISTKWTETYDLAVRKATELKDDALGVLGELRDATKPIMEAMGRFLTDPVDTAAGVLKSIWNGLLDGIAGVLDAVNLGDWAGKVRGAKFATGGVSGGPVAAFATGGVAGGIGTAGPNARLHMWNEQMGGEVFAAERGPERQQISYLQHGAAWFDHSVVPNDALRPAQRTGTREHRDARPRISSRPERRGEGVPKRRMEGFGPTMYTLVPELKRVAEAVSAKFETPWNTYSNHPGPTNDFAQPFYRERSVDFWGGGGRGDPIGPVWRDVSNMALGMIGNELDWTLNPDNDPAGHWDHVHITAFTGNRGGGGAGGGFSIPNPLQIAFDAAWDGVVKPLFDGAKETAFPGEYVMSQAGRGAIGMVEQGLHEWIDGMIPDTIGGGGGVDTMGFSGGGDPAKNRELGKKMNEAKGWGSQWGSLDALWTKESGWSNTADNPTSDAYGIPQGMMGPGGSTPPPGYMPPKSDPAVQIAWGLDYIAGRYGDPNAAWGHSQRMGWYERGGIIPGQPGQAKQIMAHAGELVLPMGVAHSFVEFTEALRETARQSQRMNGSTAEELRARVGGYAGASREAYRDPMVRPGGGGARAAEANLALARKLDSLNETVRQQQQLSARVENAEELAGVAARAVVAGLKSDAFHGEVDEKLARAIEIATSYDEED